MLLSVYQFVCVSVSLCVIEFVSMRVYVCLCLSLCSSWPLFRLCPWKDTSHHFFPHNEGRIVDFHWIPHSLLETLPWAWLKECLFWNPPPTIGLLDPTQTSCNLTCRPHRFPQVPRVLLQSVVLQTITFCRIGQGHKHWFSTVTCQCSHLSVSLYILFCLMARKEKEKFWTWQWVGWLGEAFCFVLF